MNCFVVVHYVDTDVFVLLLRHHDKIGYDTLVLACFRLIVEVCCVRKIRYDALVWRVFV